MTQQTITAVFNKREEATRAIDELVRAGIPRTSIRLMPENDVAPASSTSSTTYDTTRDERGFWATLGDLFMPDEDRHSYAEAMHRGSIMLSVVVDEAHAARAENILEEHGTVNMEEREASWRKEGWKDYSPGSSAAAAGMSTTARTGIAGTPARAAGAGSDETISLVEEQLKIGKRQVSGGRVKVRSYVVETPVSEQVSLRDETVSVERRPMDRAMTEAESGGMFQDRTIEAEEHDEEAVASKSARVTGEVIVKKGVEQRTETIKDSVRSTKVDVDDDRAGRVRDAQRR